MSGCIFNYHNCLLEEKPSTLALVLGRMKKFVKRIVTEFFTQIYEELPKIL